MLRSAFSLLIACLALVACGDSDEAYLSIQVLSPQDPAPVDDLRRFPPNEPLPQWIQVTIWRTDDLAGRPVVDLESAWTDLEEDPGTSKKFLLLTVSPNKGLDYSYLLRLASFVEGDVDECGVVGRIQAARGAKVRLHLGTHEDECGQTYCLTDQDCGAESYCLSFECQPNTMCGNCPDGAYCDAEKDTCASACGAGANLCEGGFDCCVGICSASCPEGL